MNPHETTLHHAFDEPEQLSFVQHVVEQSKEFVREVKISDVLALGCVAVGVHKVRNVNENFFDLARGSALIALGFGIGSTN